MSREDIRNAIMSAKPTHKTIELYGQKVEFVQPTAEAVLTLQAAENPVDMFVSFMIKYAKVPGTSESVFEDSDADSLKALPFGPEFEKIIDVVNGLTSFNKEEAVKNSGATGSDSK